MSLIERYYAVKQDRDLLRRRLSTAVDKELLLLMQVIEQQETIEHLRASLKAAGERHGTPSTQTGSDRS